MSTRGVSLTNQLKQLADKVVKGNQEHTILRKETIAVFSLVRDVTDSVEKHIVDRDNPL